MSDIKEIELEEIQYKESLDKLYSLRITKSQHEKLKKNPKLKEMIARYVRLCLETYPDSN